MVAGSIRTSDSAACLTMRIQTAFERVLWSACGVDPTVLIDVNCPESERQRYSALGSMVILGVVAGVVAGYLAVGYVFFPNSAQGVLSADIMRPVIGGVCGLLWGLFILNLLRLTIGLAGRQSDRLSLHPGSIGRAVAIVLVTGALAIATASPVQVMLTERDADARALALRQLDRLVVARAGDMRAVDALATPLETLLRSPEYGGLTPPRTDCTGLEDCRRLHEELAQTITEAPELRAAQRRVRSGQPQAGDMEIITAAEFDVASAEQNAYRFSQLDGAQTRPGFFIRTALAYETNPQFCLAILLGFWLLLIFPPGVRLLTDRSAYDFLVEHRNRRWLAASGIEMRAYMVFKPDGRSGFVDAFHAARKAFRDRQAQILAERRYEDELLRQRAAARLAEIRSAGRLPDAADGFPQRGVLEVHARKRVVTVNVEFAEEKQDIETREGLVVADPRDAVVTALTGERWPVPRAVFDARYVPIPPLTHGSPGQYHTRPSIVRAMRLLTAASVEVAQGRSELAAKAGDWIVNYGNGNLGVIADELFLQTYELPGMKGEDG